MESKSITLSIGGVELTIQSRLPLGLLEGTAAFAQQEAVNAIPIQVEPVDRLPDPQGMPCGEDGLFDFYQEGDICAQRAIPGTGGSLSMAVYPRDGSSVRLYLNEGSFPGVVRTVDKVLQLLPMRRLLTRGDCVLLHGSTVAVGNRTLVFTAPSQTGKTTQARLWHRLRGAELLTNDRVVLRKTPEGFVTCGYPVDGSSPVYSSRQLPLGAVVVLAQGQENRVERLGGGASLRALMEQTAFDIWDPTQRLAVELLWLALLERYPVYLLTCTPDEGAVTCLQAQLEKDEVLPYAGNS